MVKDRMSDHRDIFNSLICASVEAFNQSKSGKARLEWLGNNKILDRKSLASFLWTAYRELNGHDSLGWCNYEAYRQEERMVVEVLLSKTPRKVYKGFIIPICGNLVKSSSSPIRETKRGYGVINTPQ